LCTLSEALDRFWVVSCEFSSHVEKFLPKSSRDKRSIVVEEPNWDDPDPEELFNYLYPLADLTPEDFVKEGQRSSSSSNTIYSWFLDLAHLWLVECRERAGENNSENEDEEVIEMSKIILSF
jgi:hypothetical protein